MELRFLRDTDKREVDFIVLKDGKPLFAVECKTGDKNVNPFLSHFMERTDIPAFYQVHTGTSDYEKKGVRVPPLCTFCDELRLPEGGCSAAWNYLFSKRQPGPSRNPRKGGGHFQAIRFMGGR